MQWWKHITNLKVNVELTLSFFLNYISSHDFYNFLLRGEELVMKYMTKIAKKKIIETYIELVKKSRWAPLGSVAIETLKNETTIKHINLTMLGINTRPFRKHEHQIVPLKKEVRC